MRLIKTLASFPLVILLFSGCSANNEGAYANSQDVAGTEKSSTFSIVVIPDTQNYIDYTHQKNKGFAVNGRDIFLAQMKDIAKRGKANNGNLVFVTSVGDVWQHQTLDIDPGHKERGFSIDRDPRLKGLIEVTSKTIDIEIPIAIEGYKILENAQIPFGVVPGNHDYDAAWFENPNQAHIGGLTNYLSVFAANGAFFKDREWYIDSFKNGTNSAQKFKVGNYTFLHFSLEMQAGDDVLEWVQSVISANANLPTILSTHDYLNAKGERKPDPGMDLAQADPSKHNSAEQLWEKIIFNNDQIFLVLSGHQLGQATRVDLNSKGHKVYQLMANYQARGQIGIDAGQGLEKSGQATGLGDGWYRVLEFHLDARIPELRVSTYSSHYKHYSRNFPMYANLYKGREQPDLSDSQFLAQDDFKILLTGFRARFSDFSH